MTDASLPLVSIVVLVYNQERYVRDAVEAALAQSYPRLEVLVSDDDSNDDSVAIAAEVLSGYTGPHMNRLNVNQHNLGIGGHINRVFELAKGDLIILAAGDDVSLPDRTSRIVDSWINAERRPSAVYCRARTIDAEGRRQGEITTALESLDPRPEELISYDASRPLLLLGACAAYTREVIDRFGPLLPRLTVEDIPLTVRASLLGGIAVVDDALVDYRINVSVWLPRKLQGETFDRHTQRLIHRIHANYWVSRQILIDAHSANNLLALQAAKRRFTAATFALKTCRRRRFDLCHYAFAAKRSGHWRSALLPALLLALPLLHRFMFKAKNAFHTDP